LLDRKYRWSGHIPSQKTEGHQGDWITSREREFWYQGIHTSAELPTKELAQIAKNQTVMVVCSPWELVAKTLYPAAISHLL
jgi:hypothetical protein